MVMQQMRLLNFQGIKEALFDFGGNSASVYGDNATGKTTIYNAMTWLLFDKSSTGSKSFIPKTKDKTGGDIHNLEHSAEMSFMLDNGRILTLKKVFKEVYKKKRGAIIAEFDGHTNEYFIDGVPCATEGEYKSAIENYCGTETQIKLLTMPNYFAEVISKEERRELLLEICEDITDADVIQSTPELKDLPKRLLMPGTEEQYYTVDEYKRIAAAKCAEINNKLKAIPERIDEATRALPEVDGISPEVLDSEIESIAAEIIELEREKSRLANGIEYAPALRERVSTLQTELAESRANYAARNSKDDEMIYAAINRLMDKQAEHRRMLAAINKEVDSETRRMDDIRARLDKLAANRKKLRDEYARAQAEQWDGSETCPTCGQSLPEGAVLEAKEKFNISKSRRLEEINKKGQRECNKEMIDLLSKEIKTAEEKLEALELSKRSLMSEIETCEQSIQTNQQNIATPMPFENTEEYSRITAKIEALRNDENAAAAATALATQEISANIDELENRRRELQNKKSLLTLAEQQSKRIKELVDTEKKISSEFEHLQHGLHLCDVFIKSKVSMITDKINSRFTTLRFRLFVDQQNGGVREDCEVMIPSDGRLVPFAFANNAARINAGLEIIDTLAKHWNISLPVFVDNAESVTKLLDIDGQVIRLVVNETDKQLRMELDSLASDKMAV